jgi:hypothetical protein
MLKNGVEGDLLTAPKSLGQALFCRVQDRAAAGPGEEEWSPAELSRAQPAQPCALSWQGTVLSREEEPDQKDSCSKAEAGRQKPWKKP